jgi:hypothetical protein
MNPVDLVFKNEGTAAPMVEPARVRGVGADGVYMP